MASRKLIVEVVGDSRSLERTFDRSTKASRVFGREVTGNTAKVNNALERLGRGRAGAFAAGAGFGLIGQQVAGQAKAAIDVASNLNEQIARNAVVFEGSSKAIEEWSKTTASSMGIARDQALAAAGTFGAMFDQAGLSSGKAAEFSKTMVRLASDLASFNNASIEDTLGAIRSGLSGEIEPLRRFQVFLTEAAVSQRALTQSGKDNVKELTQGEKILARYSLIMEQTIKQQGDFARTSGSLANQQRTLAAQTRDLQGQLGQALLPAMTAITGALVDATAASAKLTEGLKKLGNVKIPTITIPFTTKKIGGGGGLDLLDPLLGVGEFLPIGGPFIKGLRLQMDKMAREAAKAAEAEAARQTTELANAFSRSINTMFTNAMDTAIRQADITPTATLPPSFGQAGFAALTGGASAAAIKAGQEALDQARGNLQGVLASQIATRDQLKRNYDLAVANFTDQTKVDAAYKRWNAAVVAVTNTQKTIAANQESSKKAAQSAAEAAKATAQANREAAAATAQQVREAVKAAEQIRQFRALGLDATGSKPPPTIGNLLKQITQLDKTDLSKNELGVLNRIRKVLVDPLKKATPETRAAAKGLIDGMRDELDVDKKIVGPLTKTTSLRANKLIEGLGLGPDQIRELRARLSSFNSAGLANAGTTRPTGNFTGGTSVIETHTTVNLDGQVVGKSVTRTQQKQRKRNPVQKRGSRRGGV